MCCCCCRSRIHPTLPPSDPSPKPPLTTPSHLNPANASTYSSPAPPLNLLITALVEDAIINPNQMLSPASATFRSLGSARTDIQDSSSSLAHHFSPNSTHSARLEKSDKSIIYPPGNSGRTKHTPRTSPQTNGSMPLPSSDPSPIHKAAMPTREPPTQQTQPLQTSSTKNDQSPFSSKNQLALGRIKEISNEVDGSPNDSPTATTPLETKPVSPEIVK